MLRGVLVCAVLLTGSALWAQGANDAAPAGPGSGAEAVDSPDPSVSDKAAAPAPTPDNAASAAPLPDSGEAVAPEVAPAAPATPAEGADASPSAPLVLGPGGLSAAPVVDIPARPGIDRPQPRPEGFDRAIVERKFVLVAPRPPKRPDALKAQAQKRQRALQRGAVCGIAGIQGQATKSFGNPASGCGIRNPVRVKSVAGVALSRPANIDCTTAIALMNWVERAAKPQLASMGGGLSQIDVVASYACRTRNSRPGAKLSEHAKGHAVDIAGVRLRDGTRVTVLKHWNSGAYGRALRAMHKKACGIFGTVLGPNANAYHRDHFHFDTARYRSGSYCR